MKLESKFDYRALRKAQSAIVRKFNQTGKSIEKLGLSPEDYKAIEAVLTKAFDAELQKAAAGTSAEGAIV